MSHARSWSVIALVASACSICPSSSLPPATSPYPPSSTEDLEAARTKLRYASAPWLLRLHRLRLLDGGEVQALAIRAKDPFDGEDLGAAR